MSNRLKREISNRVEFAVLESLALLGLVWLVFELQFTISTIFGADGYLHIRMAEFLRDLGTEYDFHWARFSVFATDFSDKDFLFHVFLMPFTHFENIFVGAKYAAAVSSSVLILTMYVFLRKWGRRALVVPFLLLFLSPHLFLYESCRPRPFSLVTALTLCLLFALVYRKHLWIFTLTVVYCLLHVSGPYALIFALIVEAVRYTRDGTFAFKNILIAILGIMAGFLLHPHFPNNVYQFYLNAILVPYFAATKAGIALGAEFLPFSSREFLSYFPFLTGGFLACLALTLVRRVRFSLHTAVLFCVSICFYVFAFSSRRYLVHVWPLAVLFFASFANDCLEGEKRRRLTAAIAGVIVIGSISAFSLHYDSLRRIGRTTEYLNRHYEEMAGFARENVPAGELIFHANWSDSQHFIGLNPANDYLVTLDPVYMYAADEEKYRIYQELAGGGASDPFEVMKDVFDANHGYAGKVLFPRLVSQIRKDERFSILLEDKIGIFFRLEGDGEDSGGRFDREPEI